MASLDMTSFAAGLKAYYTRDKVENMVYSKNPLLAIMPKMEKFYGKNLPIPVLFGNPQGRSATFATAQANKTASKIKDFTLTRVKDYALASIDNETLEASQNDAGAFMEAATVEIDGAIQSATRSLATALYRDGSGVIGIINATVTGTTLTLATSSDIVNFEVGMQIQFSELGTSATLRDSGDVIEVTAINRSAGSMTLAENLNTISGLTAGDSINVQGDIEGKVKGLEAWLPQSVTSTAFFGLDRTTDSVRLAGVKYDGSAQPIEEALVDGLSLLEREGGAPGHCFTNFANLSNLKKAMGSKVQYVDVKGPANLSFKGIQIDGNKEPVTVIGDQNCPAARAYFLDMSVWKFYSLGMAPKILSSDGLKMLREGSADSLEIRVGYYGQLGCRAPGWNGVVKLAS
jgi:hypothetical protein